MSLEALRALYNSCSLVITEYTRDNVPKALGSLGSQGP